MSARKDAKAIFNAAVSAVHPNELIPVHLRVEGEQLIIFDQKIPRSAATNIYVIGAGKASAAMAQVTERLMGSLLTKGIIVTKNGHALPLQKIRCLEAGHPVPDERSLTATASMLELLATTTNDDIIICLLSGGASSVWADVPAGATFPDLQQVFSLLLKSGARIEEMNAVRKHLSRIKGGQLLQQAAPGARWFSFIISDVPDDRLDTIGSGPTVPDESSFADVQKILDKYGITGKLPPVIAKHIADGLEGLVPETLKPAAAELYHIEHKIIGSNKIALRAAEASAKSLGYEVPFIDDTMNGDAATVGREFTRSCKKYTGPRPACFLLGGETTVTVKGTGTGGRNQHMALSSLVEMTRNNEPGYDNRITFLAAGTDGTDGDTPVAGAVADQEILDLMNLPGISAEEALLNFDSNRFFKKVNGLYESGPTQTNVMDLVVVIVE